MNDSENLAILTVIFFIMLSVDIITSKSNCVNSNISRPEILKVIILHHLIGTFLHFGWIFNNPYILMFYIVFMIGVLIHWFTNDMNCFLVQVENNICGIEQNKKLNILYKLINNEKVANYIYVSIAIILICVAFVKIINHYKKIHILK